MIDVYYKKLKIKSDPSVVICSNEVINALAYAIIETKKNGEDIVGVEFFFLGLIFQVDSLASRIFKKLYGKVLYREILFAYKKLIIINSKKKFLKTTKTTYGVSFSGLLERLLIDMLDITKKGKRKDRKSKYILTSLDFLKVLLTIKKIKRLIYKSKDLLKKKLDIIKNQNRIQNTI